jgi:hypothetical protein
MFSILISVSTKSCKSCILCFVLNSRTVGHSWKNDNFNLIFTRSWISELCGSQLTFNVSPPIKNSFKIQCLISDRNVRRNVIYTDVDGVFFLEIWKSYNEKCTWVARWRKTTQLSTVGREMTVTACSNACLSSVTIITSEVEAAAD